MALGHKTGGRKKGTPNQTTMLAREAISRLVDNNAHRMEAWLDEIAEKHGPLTAWRCMSEVLEYHIPKLQRSELTGPGGNALEVTLKQYLPKA